MQRNRRESSCAVPAFWARRAHVWLWTGCALSVLSLLGEGCNKSERPVPPAPAALPASGAAARGASMRGAQNPHAMPMPADHPQFLQPAQPSGAAPHGPMGPQPAATAPAAGNNEGVLRGSLVLDAKLKDKAKPGAVIFLSARGAQNGAPAGPPLAVKRLTVASWPLPFELSSADAMMPGLTLRGQVVLMARIDQDEDAMTKQVGDIEGMQVITVPATSVELKLDKVRTEAAGAPSPAGLGAGMGGGMGDVHAPSPH